MRFPRKTIVVAGATMALAMIVRANFCLIGLCDQNEPVSLQAAAPPCHESAAAAVPTEESERGCTTCCDSKIFGIDLAGQLTLAFALPATTPRSTGISLSLPRPRPSLVSLDLPPPPATGPLYLRNRTLLN